MAGLFLLLVFQVSFTPGSPIFFSVKGPGSQHAPILISIVAGLLIGALAQRSRFCTMGAFRDMILIRDFHLISGVIALLIFAFVMNLILGQFRPGFEGQPIAHTDSAWNFLGMTLSGQAFAHNFVLASSPKGVAAFGPAAVIIGLIFCLVIGFTQRDKIVA